MKEKILENTETLEKAILTRLSHFFYDLRTKKKVSIKTLNTLSGVAVAVISDLENAKSMPRIETLIRLTLALDENKLNDMFNCLFDNFQPPCDKKQAYNMLWEILNDYGLNNAEVKKVFEYIEFLRFIK